MKAVVYTADAARDLKRHGNVAARVLRATAEYASDPLAHANNVTRLVGSRSSRLRVGSFRVVFVEDADSITVTRVGPRGDIYD